ncbi:ABC transporter permease [Pseudactinotalea sp.]|uniref:ABC transporter permease n=1 Tax=Pseudactinotalea sp. TaxID=1926260 RepID=UPI003B3B3BD4
MTQDESPQPRDAVEDATEPDELEAEESASEGENDETSESAPSAAYSVRDALHDMMSSSVLITLGAVVLALAIGSILILVGDSAVQATLGYFFQRPTDFFREAGRAIGESYVALFQGAIYDSEATTPERRIRPLTETLTIAVPLIFAGLGIGLTFRVGLFNIGGMSQIVLGAALGAWVGFALDLPVFVHISLVLVAAAIGGAIAGAIPGFLKARFGAHEVISTIMLNNTARYFILWLLGTAAFASATPQVSPNLGENARLPLLLGMSFRLHFGIILALVAAFGVWWLMERSVLGFQMRAVGVNPDAARTAGMSVGKVTIISMALAGMLCGLAGAMQVAGTEGKLTASVAGTIGFDAITVALLGRSRPVGTVLAGILFGALAAGGRIMSSRAGTEAELVTVLQAVIVLLIAAPPLVRSVFRLPAPDRTRKRSPRRRPKEVAA